MSLCAPGLMRAPFRSAARRLYRISLISDDFPLPEIPVMHVITPSGIFTSTSRRLFCVAPLISMKWPLPSRRCSGTSIFFRPERYFPVILRGALQISSTVPSATSSPPCMPAPGPMSTIQSASRMVSSSCSTTMSVLPRSRRRLSVAMSFELSLWCRPMLGSSSTYKTPVSAEPICVARRMRWLSPPDSVAALRASVR